MGGLAMLAWATVFTPALFLWWYSLKVAAALADSPIVEARGKARAEAARLRETGEKIDAERWRTEVEEPVMVLGRDVLPSLSEGWGLSVGLVGIGFVVMFLCFFGT